MEEREYYGVRKGFFIQNERSDIDMFKRAFLILYRKLYKEGYFQAYFGKQCVDYDNSIEGYLGSDIETAIYLKTKNKELWPIHERIESFSLVDLFTVIELLYDCSSKPISSYDHDWNNCGIHVTQSDDEFGKLDFRNQINPMLKKYLKVELSKDGEILEIVEEGFEPLFLAPIPSEDKNVKSRIDSAVIKFRRKVSTVDDRRDALRDLADVLEYLRSKIKTVLMSKEENELFQIANTFGIRHHNKNQKTDYDIPIWHSWFFYCYYSTIHACLRLIEKQKQD